MLEVIKSRLGVMVAGIAACLLLHAAPLLAEEVYKSETPCSAAVECPVLKCMNNGVCQDAAGNEVNQPGVLPQSGFCFYSPLVCADAEPTNDCAFTFCDPFAGANGECRQVYQSAGNVCFYNGCELGVCANKPGYLLEDLEAKKQAQEQLEKLTQEVAGAGDIAKLAELTAETFKLMAEHDVATTCELLSCPEVATALTGKSCVAAGNILIPKSAANILEVYALAIQLTMKTLPKAYQDEKGKNILPYSLVYSLLDLESDLCTQINAMKAAGPVDEVQYAAFKAGMIKLLTQSGYYPQEAAEYLTDLENLCTVDVETVAGLCPACTPDCTGKECGSDGCGGTCGVCPDGIGCEDNACKNIDPCLNLNCDDGDACTNDQCVVDGTNNKASCQNTFDDLLCPEICTPQCNGRECGPDGCGGVCGICVSGQGCDGGICVDLGIVSCVEKTGFKGEDAKMPLEQINRLARNGGGTWFDENGIAFELLKDLETITVQGNCQTATLELNYNITGSSAGSCSLEQGAGVKKTSLIQIFVMLALLLLPLMLQILVGRRRS